MKTCTLGALSLALSLVSLRASAQSASPRDAYVRYAPPPIVSPLTAHDVGGLHIFAGGASFDPHRRIALGLEHQGGSFMIGITYGTLARLDQPPPEEAPDGGAPQAEAPISPLGASASQAGAYLGFRVGLGSVDLGFGALRLGLLGRVAGDLAIETGTDDYDEEEPPLRGRLFTEGGLGLGLDWSRDVLLRAAASVDYDLTPTVGLVDRGESQTLRLGAMVALRAEAAERRSIGHYLTFGIGAERAFGGEARPRAIYGRVGVLYR